MIFVAEIMVEVENKNYGDILSFPKTFTSVQTLQERPVSVENHQLLVRLHLVSNQELDIDIPKNQN
jgi:aspartyl-tRNA synthetase